MTVYVDDMRAPYGRLIMCHMIADTEAELHVMADQIGVARRWHQRDHYDICLSKRAAAVAAGAQEITHRECGVMAVHRRRTGRLPTLSEVPGLMQVLKEEARDRAVAIMAGMLVR
jgi:hypothetical protein